MPILSSRWGMQIMFTMRKPRLFSQPRNKMAGRHARSRKMPSSASSVIPIIPKALAPHRPPGLSCKNSSANLDTNFGMIPFRLLTRENSQPYPVQKTSQTTTSSPSQSKMVENSSLSTKESTPVYCKAAFPPIKLFKIILESRNCFHNSQENLSPLEQEGAAQRLEYTLELA